MLCPIAGFPNYIISNEGVIYSQSREMKPFLREGYKRIQLCKDGIPKIFSIHCLVYKHFGKNWNSELTVDHINGDRADNRIENLRMATRLQQNYNRTYKKNELGRGVKKHCNKYRADISINGKKTYLGLFDTKEEASEAYKTKAKEIQGEFFKE